MKMTAPRYFHIDAAQEQKSTASEIMQESMFPLTSNFASYKSNHAGVGTSFLALLSGPASLLQCDFQQLSNSKPLITSSKPPVSNSSVIVSANELPAQSSFSQNLRDGADLCSNISSRVNVNLGGCASHNCVQTSNFNPQAQSIREFSSQQGGWPAIIKTANFRKFHSTNLQASDDVSEAICSTPYQLSTSRNGFPRVFCLGTIGDLLLSNTGLLGVVCLCHGLHMSISKFSEHSGLSNVNPGNEVRLATGETIAHWRKLYFQTFGIRVPEDHSGWDWPEGFLAAAASFRMPCDNPLLPTNSYTPQKSVNGILSDDQHRDAQDVCNFLLMGFKGNSLSNVHACTGRSDNGFRSVSSYVDFNSKNGRSIISSSTLKNLKPVVEDADISRCNPSNIELRLGQPSQQCSVPRPQLIDTLDDPKEFMFQEHPIHRRPISWMMGEQRQFLQCTAGASNYSVSREQGQLNLANLHALGSNSAVSSAKLERFNDDVGNSSATSRRLSQLNVPKSTVIGREHLTPRTSNCDSHIAKCSPFDFTWNISDGNRREYNNNQSNTHIGRAKLSRCFLDGSYVTGESSFTCHTKQVGVSSSFNGVTHETVHFGGSDVVNDRNRQPHHLNVVAPDLSCDTVFIGSISSPTGTVPLPAASVNSVISDPSPCLLDENLKFLALQHSNPSLRVNEEHSRFNSLSGVKQVFVAEPSTSAEQRHGLYAITSKQDATYPIGSDIGKLAPVLGLENWYNYSTFTHENSVEVQPQLSHDRVTDGQPSFRLVQSGKQMFPSSTSENFYQKNPDTYALGKCSYPISTKCLVENCHSKDETSLNVFKEQMGSDGGKLSMLFSSKFNINHSKSKENAISVVPCGDKKGTVPKIIDCSASEWKDVPRQIQVCNAKCMVWEADVSAERGNVVDQIAVNKIEEKAGSLKEQEMSNISSGLSAPAVTQASVAINNLIDSCTEENDLVIDEGSGIDECWSSEDGLDSQRTAECLSFTSKFNSTKGKSSSDLPCRSSHSCFDELTFRNYSRLKKMKHETRTGLNIHGNFKYVQKSDRCLKTRKRKSSTRWKVLDESSLAFDLAIPDTSGACSVGPSRTYALSSDKIPSHKRDLKKLYNYQVGEDDKYWNKVAGSKYKADGLKIPEISVEKKMRRDRTDDDDTVKNNSITCIKVCSDWAGTLSNRKARPIVTGKYGIISNVSKPPRIVSLRRIIENARRCAHFEIDEPRITLKKIIKASNGCFDHHSSLKKVRENEICSCIFCNEVDPCPPLENRKEASSIGDKKECQTEISLLKQRNDQTQHCHSAADCCPSARLKAKSREVRKRSLQELTRKEKESSCGKFYLKNISNCELQPKCRSVKKFHEDAESLKHGLGELSQVRSNGYTKESSFPSLVGDLFCCVCGGANNDEVNCLLECSKCLIKVHQACYGVRKAPRSYWYCRPCRASAKDIACVLCGYGGGAMTRALRCHSTVKNLLNVWKIPTESSKLTICNSITEGAIDSTIKQWVHMVCGLWTPGTRCPNVDTMSAFDVSGASRPTLNVVCSMCDRPGGSCIRCRDKNCSVRFHPWCAHKKGLLQSEVEGVDSESVGFYGRCALHAMYNNGCVSDSSPIDIVTGNSLEKDSTCARTEGYKGRKSEGFRHNLYSQSHHNSGGLVPQEQLDAWLHINSQKSYTKGVPKPQVSDIERDCRKEYARYKQTKGWKHLVVYKSGIHALGLYTSHFISRGAMVVEYIGEIVGLRVADKRENEYESGRKVQYKSACYFFRIDKEHIIDATRKGGIARFVNHSCLPNCVAKIISLKNEKKVVFFAERDINPGEEITYDYHFNHEDEGKKIPCFCNSKNCRRYLN